MDYEKGSTIRDPPNHQSSLVKSENTLLISFQQFINKTLIWLCAKFSHFSEAKFPKLSGKFVSLFRRRSRNSTPGNITQNLVVGNEVSKLFDKLTVVIWSSRSRSAPRHCQIKSNGIFFSRNELKSITFPSMRFRNMSRVGAGVAIFSDKNWNLLKYVDWLMIMISGIV